MLSNTKAFISCAFIVMCLLAASTRLGIVDLWMGSGSVAMAATEAVTIESPTNGSTDTSPVHVHATFNGTASYMKLWVDHVANTVQHNGSTFDTPVSLSNGSHLLEVQAADASTGVVFTTPVTITVGSTGQTVTVTPASATVVAGGTQQFSANVPVTWSASGDGVISTSGLFTAGNAAGSATVTATTTDGSGATGTANVTVTSSAAEAVTIENPTNGSTVASPVNVHATFNGTAAYMKLWIDHVASTVQMNTNIFDTSATLASGNHLLEVQAQDATSKIVFTTPVNITVGAAGLTITPSTANTVVGQTQQFTANAAVTWSASCGTIDSSGLFTAPSTVESCTITATGSNNTTATAIDNVVASPPPASGNYTTWKNDNFRTGQQTNETQLTLSNVNSSTFRLKFTDAVDGQVFAQPLYMSGLRINGSTHNVVFVATEHDSVYAFDADVAGAPLWHRSFLVNGASTVPHSFVGSTINPETGITGTPVIDPSSGILYVVAETLEAGVYVHRLHALDVHTGSETGGSPVTVAASGFGSKEQLQRTGLLLANGNVYFAFGSQGDHPPYHGWIFGYATGGLRQVAAFDDTPGGSAGGIWMSGQGLAADSSGDIYFSSGNGNWNGTTQFSTSWVKLSPSLQVLDWFTPFNQASLSASDVDLGSGGVLLVPDQPGTFKHVMIGCGKAPTLYVVNRDNMGHINSGSDSQIIQSIANAVGNTGTATNHCFMTPAYSQQNLYFIGNNDVIKAFHLDPATGKMTTSPTSQGSFAFKFPGAQTVVSSNGSSNAIVWAVDSNSAALHAYDASDVSREIFRSTGLGSLAKWAVPTIINGKVYVAVQGKLAVFGL